jgi:dTMP kinase
MPARGKFIVLEGIDGSGKRTQMEMLARALVAKKIESTRVSFPRYEGFFGKMVAQFLNGEFGPLDGVDPHFSALLYAGDRLESKPELEAALAEGRTVLADRYIGSNLAHQGARATPRKRAEFLKWLKQLEYEVYGLPKEDIVVYLHVPPREAHRLVGKKAARAYTKRRRDLQEANLAHLEAASEVYDELSRQPNWVRIECADVARERIRKIEDKALRKVNRRSRKLAGVPLRTPEAIHEDILAAVVEARVFPALSASAKG